MMISLHSVLAIADTMKKLPTIVAIASGALMALAFIVGFFKGFRKVGWNGLIWATAGTIFLLISRSINPTGSVTRKFVYAMLIALACIAGALALYGVLAYYLRPRVRWVKDNVNGDTTLAEYGLEFEPEYLDYDGENESNPYGKRIQRTGFTPPCFAFRLLGGLTCAINVGVILWAIASALLLAINATSLAQKNIGLVLQEKNVQKVLEFAQLALLEAMCIGVVILVAKKGYSNGLINSIRVILITFGTMAAIGGCFYLPFSKFASDNSDAWYLLTNFTNRCIKALDGKVPFFDKQLGQILAGACLSCVAVAIMVGLNVLLKKCCRFVSKTGPTKLVDTVLSCVLYMAIGAAVCVAIWFVLATMDHFGLFHISEVLAPKAHLSNGLYNFGKYLLDKLLAL